MPTKVSRCQAVRLFSAVLVSWVGSTVAAQVQREPGQPETAKEPGGDQRKGRASRAVASGPNSGSTGAASHHCGAGVSVDPVRGR